MPDDEKTLEAEDASKEQPAEQVEETSSEKEAVSTEGQEQVSGDTSEEKKEVSVTPEMQAAIDVAIKSKTGEIEKHFQSVYDKNLETTVGPLKKQISQLELERDEAKESKADEVLKEKLGEGEEADFIIAERKRMREEQRQIVAAKAQQQAEIANAAKDQKEIDAYKIGKEYNIDPQTLIDDAEITNPDQMRLKAMDAVLSQRAARIKELETLPVKPDKGGSDAGGGTSYSTVSFEPNAPTGRDMISRGVKKK